MWARWRSGHELAAIGKVPVPLVAGLVIATLFLDVPTIPNPIVHVRVDLGTLAISWVRHSPLDSPWELVLWAWSARRCKQHIQEGVRVQAVEERRRFLQRLDHEIKNPLTAIRAALVNVANGSTASVQQEALTSAEAQVLRLSRLTSDLRKLAEMETRPLERAPVDVPELLQEAVALAMEQSGSDERQLN